MKTIRHLTHVVLTLLTLLTAAPPAARADGELDTTFGAGTGKVFTGLPTGGAPYDQHYAWAVALQPDGKLVVAGQASRPGAAPYTDMEVIRFTAAGALDTTFGTNGRVLTDFAGGYDDARAVFVLSDGKILSAGLSAPTAGSPFTYAAGLARYTSAGVLDTTFGTGGKASIFPPSGSWSATCAALQGDGKVIVAGYLQGAGGLRIALFRFLANGAADTTFGTGGMATAGPFATFTYPQAIALRPDGRVLVAGSQSASGSSLVMFHSFNANGSADTTFGTGGLVTMDIGATGGYDTANSLALLPDGKALAGVSGSLNALMRITTAGALDTTFGTAGYTQATPAPLTDLSILADGKIGWVGTNGSSFYHGRFTAAGAPDTTLGGANGYVSVALDGGSYPYTPRMAVQPDGNVIISGTSHLTWAMVRLVGPAPATAPVVTTPTFTNVTTSTATLGGNVTSDGGSAVTERGVVYAVTAVNADPQLGGTGVSSRTTGGTTGIFAVAVSGLAPGTGYSFKTYVTNSVGTSYTGAATFTTVPDTTPPSLTVNSPSEFSFTTNGATVTLSGFASDITGVTAVTWVNTATGASGAATGTTFWTTPAVALAEGANTVEVTARDAAGNTAQGSRYVFRDSVPPVLPGDVTVEATGPSGATLDFTATDAGSGVQSTGSSHGSGSTFPPGETTVSFSATDYAGNFAAGSFKVTVVDTTAPMIQGPLSGLSPATVQTVPATGLATVPDYRGQVSSSDAVSVPVVIQTPSAGTQVPVGSLLVTVRARDAAGNFSGAVMLDLEVTAPPNSAPVVAADGGAALIAIDDHFTGNSSSLPAGWSNIFLDPSPGTGFAESGTTVTIADGRSNGPTLMKSASFGAVSALTATVYVDSVSGAAGTEPTTITGIGGLAGNVVLVQFNTVSKRFAASVLSNSASVRYDYTLAAGQHVPASAGGSFSYAIVAGTNGFHVTSGSYDSGELLYSTAGVAGFTSLAQLGGTENAFLLGTECGGSTATGTLCSIAYDRVVLAGTAVGATTSVTAAEGVAATQTGTFSDADGNATVTLSASAGTITQDSDAGTWSWTATGADGPASSTVTITATDDATATATADFTFTVTNAVPTVAISAPATADEDAAVSFTFTATDASAADQAAGFAWALDYGDGTGAQSVGAGTASPLARTHTFADPGTYTVTATATDKDGGMSTLATRDITIAAVTTNVPGLTGRYTVLLDGPGGSALMTVKLGTGGVGGVLSGTLRLPDGSRIRIPTTRLSAAHTATLNVGGSMLTITFDSFGHMEVGGAFTGTGDMTTRTLPANVPGRYSAILEAEDGALGWLTLVVSPTGSVRVAGRLPDGSKVLAGAGTLYERDSEVTILAISGAPGHPQVAGRVAFADLGTSDMAGSLTWRDATGVSQGCEFSGAKAGAGPAGSLSLVIDGAGISVAGVVTLGASSSFTAPVIGLSYRSNTGIFLLSFRASLPKGPTIRGSGVYQQKLGVGAGNFIYTGQAGRILIGP